MTTSIRPMPILPAEIIDNILRLKDLDDDDLAGRCLVNRIWLDAARKSLYDFPDVRFVGSGPDSDTEGETPIQLDATTTMLLSTLLANRNLCQLVHSLCFDVFGREGVSPDGTRIRMRSAEIVALFARICPGAEVLIKTGFSWFTDTCQAAFRIHGLKVVSISVHSVLWGDWEDLRRFKSLRFLDIFEIELDPVPSPLSVAKIHMASCSEDTFKTVEFSTWQSLRALSAPVQLVSVLRPSHFPELRQLDLVPNYDDPANPELKPLEFFEDLKASKALEVFGLSGRAYTVLGPYKHDLGIYFPPTCRRANLCSQSSLDAILAVTRRTSQGRRIREVGLETSVQDEKDDFGLTFLMAARALLQALGVELIWYD